jgi:hypothetical protein
MAGAPLSSALYCAEELIYEIFCHNPAMIMEFLQGSPGTAV